MSTLELRASFGLASIFGLRLLGMFVILPVFALYAEHLPGGNNHTLIGIALGIYGFTQAVLQIPFGWLSDRFGRKRILYIGLIIFALGSFLAAIADTIYMVILGRMLQGAGAISAVVIALAADLTTEANRTKVMALIGMTIGFTFALSLIIAPILNDYIGVPGIFALTGFLVLGALLVVRFVIPEEPQLQERIKRPTPAKFSRVLGDLELMRLNYGIFALHAALTALFVAVPFALRNTGLPVKEHWYIYLPVMLASMLLIAPAIFFGERKWGTKNIFICAVAVLLVGQLLLAAFINGLWGIFVSLVVFFTAFNLLEALLPSLVSRVAPKDAKGTATGIYSSVQFLGMFFGAVIGGWLSQHYSMRAVFEFCALLTILWLIIAIPMKAPKTI